MAGIARWNLSPETRARFTQILDEAPQFGVDRDAVAAAGLPGLRALVALKQAAEAGTERTRDRALTDAQAALRTLEYRRYPKLVSQFQARILALRGRGNDTEMAHVARGEMVVPQALQNPKVLAALREASAAYGVPMEMLLVGNARNRINPETGTPEFGVMDWISGLFHKDANSSQDESDENRGEGAGEGLAAHAARVGMNAAEQREDYIRRVSALDPTDSRGRTQLKGQFRADSPNEFRPALQEQPLGPKANSSGSANKTNPTVNRIVRGGGALGKGFGVLGAMAAVDDVANADNPGRAAAANLGALIGGRAGGTGLGLLGTLTGPAAPILAPAGALVGSLVGGNAGYHLGEDLYDGGEAVYNVGKSLYDHFRRPGG
ncbi:MAG: hypothetical protein ACYCZX_04670 [Rhodospirillaceae bacterium]